LAYLGLNEIHAVFLRCFEDGLRLTDFKTRKNQKAFLFCLFEAKNANKTIGQVIAVLKAEMEPEDYACVEKSANEEFGKKNK